MKTVSLDLSTISNPAATAQHPQNIGGDGGVKNWAIHEIIAVSALVVERDPRRGLIFQLSSFSRADRSEAGIVREIDRICGDGVRTLLTYNGRGFDLPLLRLRAVANWADAPNLHKITSEIPHAGAVHRDMSDIVTSRGAAPKPRLADVCAALNIPSKEDLHTEAVVYVHQDRWDRAARLCEIDVISTWLVNLHLEAHESTDLHRVQDGWTALAEWIAADETRLARLDCFTRLPEFGCPPIGSGVFGDRPLAEVAF
ncbi:hypothetical protein [Glacieibacterium frigidum]|uniref:Predicted 3'-5' exonuclease PolB-like domain-containing protein n=1 Tax=Glacieibacterium frigidum TaxID=2593303 RepID=A0A552U996_9SPHN|nr:hypothetical protein [Glacieibacterium frigidum]TRW14797.1 hypothetical protein FMM06_14045 [Glacieibacterium frigidum]